MVNALVIRRNTQLAKAQKALRAAQYVRCRPNSSAIRYRTKPPPSRHTLSNATSLSFGLMSTKDAAE